MCKDRASERAGLRCALGVCTVMPMSRGRATSVHAGLKLSRSIRPCSRFVLCVMSEAVLYTAGRVRGRGDVGSREKMAEDQSMTDDTFYKNRRSSYTRGHTGASRASYARPHESCMSSWTRRRCSPGRTPPRSARAALNKPPSAAHSMNSGMRRALLPQGRHERHTATCHHGRRHEGPRTDRHGLRLLMT